MKKGTLALIVLVLIALIFGGMYVSRRNQMVSEKRSGEIRVGAGRRCFAAARRS